MILVVSLAFNLFQYTEIEQLRHEVATLRDHSHRSSPPQSVAEIKPHAPDDSLANVTTAKIATETLYAQKTTEKRAAGSVPAAVAVPDKCNVIPEEFASLTNHLVLFPNGLRSVENEEKGALEIDPLAANLTQGFHLLDSGQKADAAFVFETILAAKPDWPYAYYYLALANGKRDSMRQANEQFKTLKKLHIAPFEAELYYVLSELFLKKTKAVEIWLEEYSGKQIPQKLNVGPLYIPKSTPSAIKHKLQKLEGLPLLQTANDL